MFWCPQLCFFNFLPRQMNSLQSSAACSSVCIGSCCFLLMFMTFISSWLISRPACCEVCPRHQLIQAYIWTLEEDIISGNVSLSVWFVISLIFDRWIHVPFSDLESGVWVKWKYWYQRFLWMLERLCQSYLFASQFCYQSNFTESCNELFILIMSMIKIFSVWFPYFQFLFLFLEVQSEV